MNRLGMWLSTLLLVVVLMSSTLFVVDQRQFGVVYALGQIKEVVTKPGLHFKLPPPLQNVNYIDKRLLTLDSTDTELLSLTRYVLMTDVKREVLELVKGGDNPWGVDIVDVRITRADYVDTITESVYRRMEAERKRVANELRSTGAAEGEKIRADADRQREVTIANAYRDAQKIKGEGDAQAARIYGEAFGRDPQFAQFYRSLEAYKASFGKKSDIMVLDPASSDFFKTMRGAGVAAPARK